MDHTKTIQELFRQIEVLSNRVKQLEGLEAEVVILRKGNAQLRAENVILREENAHLRAENAILRKENAQLRADNAILRAENTALRLDVAELKARIDSNSRNSHKPPSSDGYTKKPAFPREKGGQVGGQTGHKGSTLQQVEVPDEIIVCTHESCTCGKVFTPDDYIVTEKRQVFDIPAPKLIVKEYQLVKAICSSCGKEHTAVAPEGVNSPAQYGNHIKALAVLLNVHHKLPYKRMQGLFNDLFGYPVNESTLYSASQRCYELLEQSEQVIKSQIINSDVLHADETGLRVDGGLKWLHAATTLFGTYLFIDDKRGSKAIQGSKSVLTTFTGWLIHDCWSSYFTLGNTKHGLCGTHILRELTALIENNSSQWAQKLKKFLLLLYGEPIEERIKRRSEIESLYDEIIAFACREEPPPYMVPGKRGRMKRTKGRNLAERLEREKSAMLAFAFNPEVPFTNNLVERDIRPTKIKQKVSNCFRTTSGAEIYARIESFLSTARKQNQNVYQQLCATFEGQNFLTSSTSS